MVIFRFVLAGFLAVGLVNGCSAMEERTKQTLEIIMHQMKLMLY